MYQQSEKKLVKQQYLLHMCSEYGELRLTSSWDRFRNLGHPSKFQRVSHVHFVAALTSLTGDRQNFARCLAVSWAGTLYVHFRGSCPLTEICQVQNSLYVQVLCSHILACSVTARHSSSRYQSNLVAWYTEWNYGTFAVGATYIWLGGHHIGHQPTF